MLTRCLAAGDAEAGLRICTAVSPAWIVRGAFAEGTEWLDAFLAVAGPAVPPGVRGPASGPGPAGAARRSRFGRRAGARAGLALCRSAGVDYWTAAALNLLAESALHTAGLPEAAAWAAEALTVARQAGDVWHEGYALGTQAAIAAAQGQLREASQLAHDSIGAMGRIDHHWGIARALLGLADLARLRGDPRDAHVQYQEALPILREIDARPQIARCLAGLGRAALDVDDLAGARQYLAESIRLSRSTGSRIGMTRALEAFAALAIREKEPDRVVRLTAAASALRDAAGLPALHGARLDRYLAPARDKLSPADIGRLWAQGLALNTDAAVTLALNAPSLDAPSLDAPALSGAPQDVPVPVTPPATPAGWAARCPDLPRARGRRADRPGLQQQGHR